MLLIGEPLLHAACESPERTHREMRKPSQAAARSNTRTPRRYEGKRVFWERTLKPRQALACGMQWKPLVFNREVFS
jgi:hypothetical protein